MCLKLEKILDFSKSESKGVLIVSHDRVLLDRLADRTYYLRRGETLSVAGGYSQMLKHLRKDFESRQKKAGEIQKKINQLEGEITRRKNWAGKKKPKKELPIKYKTKAS
ncbi:MAG: hypothetical protein ACP5D6_10135 [Kosmotogaceae bacterium]